MSVMMAKEHLHRVCAGIVSLKRTAIANPAPVVVGSELSKYYRNSEESFGEY
jgi:hypothetical protein